MLIKLGKNELQEHPRDVVVTRDLLNDDDVKLGVLTKYVDHPQYAGKMHLEFVGESVWLDNEDDLLALLFTRWSDGTHGG